MLWRASASISGLLRVGTMTETTGRQPGGAAVDWSRQSGARPASFPLYGLRLSRRTRENLAVKSSSSFRFTSLLPLRLIRPDLCGRFYPCKTKARTEAFIPAPSQNASERFRRIMKSTTSPRLTISRPQCERLPGRVNRIPMTPVVPQIINDSSCPSPLSYPMSPFFSISSPSVLYSMSSSWYSTP